MVRRRLVGARRGANVAHGALERLQRQGLYGCLGREENGVVEQGGKAASAHFARSCRDLLPTGPGIAGPLVGRP